MKKLTVATLNVNQLGVRMGESILNANELILKNLDMLLNYIDSFYFNESNNKILFLHEMKYERDATHTLTSAYKKFEKVLESKGYNIIKNNTKGIGTTVGYISLVIYKNMNVSQKKSAVCSNYLKGRFVEIEVEGIVILGLHQDLKSVNFPLNDYIEEQDKEVIILGDLNVNKYKLDRNNKTEYEIEFNKLLENNICDVFGNSAVPTFSYDTRIDYILISSKLISNVMSYYQDNSTRVGINAFTDHSLLQVELNI